MAHEHKMKLSKLEHIFVTYPSWENIGGLPGVALTIQDVGVPEITLHGPSGTVRCIYCYFECGMTVYLQHVLFVYPQHIITSVVSIV